MPAGTGTGVRRSAVCSTSSCPCQSLSRTASDHPEQETRLAGDLLVDVDSALARGYPGTDAVERLIIPALDHMDLLWDARVGNALLHWLQRVLAPRIS